MVKGHYKMMTWVIRKELHEIFGTKYRFIDVVLNNEAFNFQCKIIFNKFLERITLRLYIELVTVLENMRLPNSLEMSFYGLLVTQSDFNVHY